MPPGHILVVYNDVFFQGNSFVITQNMTLPDPFRRRVMSFKLSAGWLHLCLRLCACAVYATLELSKQTRLGTCLAVHMWSSGLGTQKAAARERCNASSRCRLAHTKIDVYSFLNKCTLNHRRRGSLLGHVHWRAE